MLSSWIKQCFADNAQSAVMFVGWNETRTVHIYKKSCLVNLCPTEKFPHSISFPLKCTPMIHTTHIRTLHMNTLKGRSTFYRILFIFYQYYKYPCENLYGNVEMRIETTLWFYWEKIEVIGWAKSNDAIVPINKPHMAMRCRLLSLFRFQII